MFTGIVQGIGTVKACTNEGSVWTFTIELPSTDHLNRGASVSINGVCLTATEIHGNNSSFDVIPETLQRSNLQNLTVGAPVNVERSLKMGDELGGHLLSGHIMGLATISDITPQGEGVDLKLAVKDELMKYIHEKGYIGLNGASLTIGEVFGNEFNIHLIPETLRLTTFGTSKIGDHVNLEIDSMTQTIVATVERIMKQEN